MTVKVIKGQGQDACPPGHWALYDEVNFNVGQEGWGRVLISDESVGNLKDHGFNDHASSVVNKMDRAVAFYDDAGGGGRAVTVRPGVARNLITSDGGSTTWSNGREVGDMNDAVSAAYVIDFPLETFHQSNWYILTAVHSGKALDVAGASRDSGANVNQWEVNGDHNQKWMIKHIQNGAHILISRHPATAWT
jgi:hypothetical protein